MDAAFAINELEVHPRPIRLRQRDFLLSGKIHYPQIKRHGIKSRNLQTHSKNARSCKCSAAHYGDGGVLPRDVRGDLDAIGVTISA